MDLKDYLQLDGLGLADAIRNGQISALEALEMAAQRANILNPELNAIIHRFDERAQLQASSHLPDGPFKGVPFLLKDLLDDLAGEPTTMGSRRIRYTPDENAELVNRYLKAGVVPFGKTNLPEFGLNITTEPKAFGPAHNPWRRGFSTGGSSGGSAAAVAAGIVPIASANDGGGSIRFPAACCGIFGLKPSRGLNPSGPFQGEGWEGAVMGHIVSRSVRDSAAMLDITAGPEIGAPYRIPSPERSFLRAVEQDPKPLKIGFTRKPFYPGDIHPEAMRGLEKTVALLEELGHKVEEAHPAIDLENYWKSFMTIVAGHTAHFAKIATDLCGKKAVRGLEPGTKNLVAVGHSLSAFDFVAAKHEWHKIQYAMGQYFETYDLLLTPTLIGPPAKHGEIPPTKMQELLMTLGTILPGSGLSVKNGLAEKIGAASISRMGFTALGNITGLPGMSVPLHWTDDNLPLGMMFTGQMGDEHRLFSLAGQLERSQPWFDRLPDIAFKTGDH